MLVRDFISIEISTNELVAISPKGTRNSIFSLIINFKVEWRKKSKQITINEHFLSELSQSKQKERKSTNSFFSSSHEI